MVGKIFDCDLDDDGNTQAYRVIDIIFDADLKTTMAIFCLDEIAKPTKGECESASAAEVRTWIAQMDN